MAYTWDDLGRLVNDGTYTYTWDSASRLITVTDGISTYGFRYDGDGNRLTGISNGTLITYALDVGLALPEVLVEQGSGGTTRYLYLPNAIATDDAWSYSAADGLGSVRQQLDSSGIVESVNSYRPFGLPLEGNGGDPYGYTGEWWDGSEDRGLLFLRARYLEPKAGRFLSQDTIIPDYAFPQSIHRYSYVYNNAVNYTDPSGHTIKCPEPSETDISSWPSWRQKAAVAYCAIRGCRVRHKADGRTVIRRGCPEQPVEDPIPQPVAEIAAAFILEPADYYLAGRDVVNYIREGNYLGAGATAALTLLPGATPFWRKAADVGGNVAGKLGRPVLGFCDSVAGRILGKHVDDAIAVSDDVAEAWARVGADLSDPYVQEAVSRGAYPTAGGSGGIDPVNIGKVGETAAGINGPKQRIPSLSGKAKYRVPDELTVSTLREVKNVAAQALTAQLKDYLAYAKSTGRKFILEVRRQTRPSRPLKTLVENGEIILRRWQK